MNRIAGLSVVGALLLTGLGVAPAYADPPSSPGITLGTPTAGHITGTVTSDQPYVFVGLQPDLADRGLITLADSTGFDLPTWGYDDPAAVYASACPTDTYATDGSCSTITQSLFTPVDVTLPDADPVWFADDTVGPGQQASVTITDADGGGNLEARWEVDGNPTVTTELTRGAPTPLDLTDGDGTVTIWRCSAATPTQCTPVTPARSKTLHVHTTMTATISTVAQITSGHPSSTFTVGTNVTGTQTFSWHLERTDAPGVPVAGTGETDVSGERTVLGNTITQDGTYVVVGTVTNTDYGTLADDFASAPFVVDQHGPAVTSISRSASTIYPNIYGWGKFPSTTWLTVASSTADVVAVRVTKVGDATKTRTLAINNDQAYWDGRINDVAYAGTFLVRALDAFGNASTTGTTVVVDTRTIRSRTWTKTITARGSLAAGFIGKCSTLRRPSLRGWRGSLGYYANTKCGTQTWTASAVTTAHAILLPKPPGVLQYDDIRVDTYGAAARKRPRSNGLIRYLTTSGNWVSIRPIGPKLGWHFGQTRSTRGMVFKDYSFGWSFATAYRNKYDVAKFRVVLHYKALG